MDESIIALFNSINHRVPEFREVDLQLAKGEISKEEAREMMALIISDPRIGALVLEELKKQKEVAELFIYKPDLNVSVTVNPLIQASIAERLQFDLDVPELRSGEMMEGGTPAISVNSQSRSLVAMGAELKEAQAVIAEDIAKHREALEADRVRAELENEEITELVTAGMITEKEAVIARDIVRKRVANNPFELAVRHLKVSDDGVISPLSNPDSDPDSYKRGSVPAPVTVSGYSGSALATLSERKRQEFSWLALSSTQGRRSISPMLQDALIDALPFDIEHGNIEGTKTIAAAEWSTSIMGGSPSIHPGFAFFEVALQSLKLNLIKEMQGVSAGKLGIEVKQVSDYSNRVVGWRVVLTTAESGNE